jgi:hypothetical protein
MQQTSKFAENIFSAVTVAILTSSDCGIDEGKRLTLRNGKFRKRHPTEQTTW